MSSHARRLFAAKNRLLSRLQRLDDAGLLLARLYVSLVFFRSGLTKIRDWDSTLFLFQEEYHVPILPPEIAAWLGAGGELLLPLLLSFGLCNRLAALGLLSVNVVAAISLPEITAAALGQHQLWGVLLISLSIWGTGRLSLDHWLQRRGGAPNIAS